MSKFAEALKGTLPTEPKVRPAPGVPPAPVVPPVVPPVVTPPVVPPVVPPAAVVPPVTPAPPVAPDPDEDIVSGKRSPKSEDFKRVKAAVGDWKGKAEIAEQTAAQNKKEAEELREKLKTATTPADYEELKTQLAQYKGYAETALLEVLPEFTAKYKGRTDVVISNLKTLLGDKSAEILEVLQTPDSAAKRKHLVDLTDGMDEFTKAEIVAANRDLRQIDADRRKELSEADSKLQGIVKQRNETVTKQKQALDAVLDARLTELSDPTKGIDTFKKREKDDVWNAGVDARLKQARVIFAGQFDTPQDRAEVAVRAVSAEVYLHQARALAKENDDLKATITKLQAAGPRISGNGGGGNGGAPEKGGFLKKVVAGMGKSS